MKSGGRRTRGFFMLEAIIATMMLLIVVIMSQGFWMSCAQMIGKSRARALGTYIAEQAIEKAIAAGFNRVDTLAGKKSMQLEASSSGRPITFTVTSEITIVPIDDTLKSVQVVVKWDELDGKVVYETLLSSSL